MKIIEATVCEQQGQKNAKESENPAAGRRRERHEVRTNRGVLTHQRRQPNGLCMNKTNETNQLQKSTWNRLGRNQEWKKLQIKEQQRNLNSGGSNVTVALGMKEGLFSVNLR